MAENQSLFADRPEWADVVPLEQHEGSTPIAPIFYTPECACVHELFDQGILNMQSI